MDANLGRREFLTCVAASGALDGWLGRVAAQVPKGPRPKSCILLWMAGGPSHLDTFEPIPSVPFARFSASITRRRIILAESTVPFRSSMSARESRSYQSCSSTGEIGYEGCRSERRGVRE
ncbi:MAG: DUF1501 domain-containing protein [Planctomycetes bacterium]|nr:DUF1501 domain-containing protein [Planctomycetota bacterium]